VGKFLYLVVALDGRFENSCGKRVDFCGSGHLAVQDSLENNVIEAEVIVPNENQFIGTEEFPQFLEIMFPESLDVSLPRLV